jgi:hypothetical protein
MYLEHVILNEKGGLTTMAILLSLAMADGILAENEQLNLQIYMESSVSMRLP